MIESTEVLKPIDTATAKAQFIRKMRQKKINEVAAKIRQAAKEGLDYCYVTNLSDDIQNELKKLGYKLNYLGADTNIWIVSWWGT